MFTKFVTAISLTLAFTSPGHTAEPMDLFVTIDSDKTMSQGAALVLTGQALEQKAKVRVLLCDAAGDIALAANTAGVPLKPRGATPQQMLQMVIKAGAKVEVCALYLPNTGRKASDLLEGVTAAKPADVAAFFLQPNVRTLSF